MIFLIKLVLFDQYFLKTLYVLKIAITEIIHIIINNKK